MVKFASVLTFKPLNKSILREVYPLPKVDEALAWLSGAKMFSKLDANIANPPFPLLTAAHYIHHTSGKILLQQAPIWHIQCPRTLSTPNE